MNLHSYYAAAERPVETCVVGTGGFGQSFLGQAQRVPLMNARIAVDVTAEGARSSPRGATSPWRSAKDWRSPPRATVRDEH